MHDTPGQLLRSSQGLAWALAATLARLPGNMAPLGLVLALGAGRGPIVAGCFTAGAGLGAAWRGRAIDRAGFRAGLAREALLMAGACVLVAVAVASGAPLAPLAIVGAALGVTCSAVGVAYRAVVVELMPERAQPSGHSVDAALTDASFVISPVLAAALVAFAPAFAPFGVGAALAAASALLTRARLPDGRACGERPAAVRDWLAGALPIYLITAGVGAGYGLILAGLPERLAELGWARESAGVLFGLMSGTSMVSGIVVAARGGISSRSRVPVAALVAVFAVGVGAVALGPAPAVAAVGMATFGVPLAPLSVLGSIALARRVPSTAQAEALSIYGAVVTVTSGVGLLLAAPLLALAGAETTLTVSTAEFALLAVAIVAAPAISR